MVYIRKSVSDMARAAAIAARAASANENSSPDLVDAIAAAVAVVIFEVSPHMAPAAAALAVTRKGGSDAVATAVAAGVAAAAVGYDVNNVEKISKNAAEAFTAFITTPQDAAITDVREIAAEVAHAVAGKLKGLSSRYVTVEAAAAAAYAAYLTGRRPPRRPLGSDDSAAVEAEAKAAAKTAFDCSDGAHLPFDTTSYAAIEATIAATSRGAAKDDAVTAAARGLRHRLNEEGGVTVDAAIAAAAAAASAVPDSVPTPVPIGTFGAEGCFEVMPDCHQFTKEKLKTIMEMDTFLAGFLLFSLTGRKLSTTEEPTSEEQLQIILQTFAFGVFLAATIWTGMCSVFTDCRFALTSSDLFVPLVLSTAGFVLLLISVASAIHIELDGFYPDQGTFGQYWVTVGLGLGFSVLTVGYGVFIHMHGHKCKWKFACKCGGGFVCGVKRNRIVHSEGFRLGSCAGAGARAGNSGAGQEPGGTGMVHAPSEGSNLGHSQTA